MLLTTTTAKVGRDKTLKFTETLTRLLCLELITEDAQTYFWKGSSAFFVFVFLLDAPLAGTWKKMKDWKCVLQ